MLLYTPVIITLLLWSFVFIGEGALKAQNINQTVNENLNTIASQSGFPTISVGGEEGTTKTEVLIGVVVRTTLLFIGSIFFIIIIIASFMILTASGNIEKVLKARKLYVQSIIALLIVMFAYLISYTVSALFSFQSGFFGA